MKRESEVEGQTSPRAAKWLWLLVALLGWPVVVQLVAFLAFFADMPSPDAPLAVSGIALTGLAWFATRLAMSHGAPRGVWISIALGSVPSAALLFTAAAADSGNPLAFLAGILVGVTPPLAALIATRLRFRIGMQQTVTDDSRS